MSLHGGGGVLLGGTNTWTAVQTIQNNAIGSTSTDGLVLTNTTAAAAGAQQFSPRTHWTGQGWKTNATAASQTVDWIAEVQPVQGAANPTANWALSSQINGAGYVQLLGVESTGIFDLFGPSGNSHLSIDNSTGFQTTFSLQGVSSFTIGNAGIVILNNNAGQAGGQLGWAAAGSSTADLFLGRIAAANFQFGAKDAASPVAQTLSVQNVIAGTNNTSGVNTTIVGSLSTGSGTSGDIIIQTGGTGAGATAQNAATTALTVKGATQQVIFAGTPRINTTPSAVTHTVTIASGADSTTNFGHVLQLNMNGTVYFVPCGTVQP